MKEDVPVNWNVKNNAALRIALFFELTKINFSKFEQEILKRGFLFSNVNKIRDVITKSLFLFIDDLFTPIVITSLLENEQDLCGKSSQEKYASFFITKDLYWQENALKIKKNHPFLIKNLKKLVVKEMGSYLFFLKVLEKDKEQIISNFKISSSLVKNLTLNLSDHHNFMGTAIEVTFENGQKVVYKPRNASSDQIFNKLMKVLNSSKNFCIKTPQVLNFCKYHWVKGINYIPCKTDEDLHIFYKNVGILMGILDMFNYSDGHDENFIVSNKNFILIDTETLFTNLSYFVSRTKNYFDLEFTGMIPPKDKKMHYIPVLQKSNKEVYYPYKPYILNDNSDKISLEYRQILKHKMNKSLPLKSEKIKIKRFKNDLIEGLLLGYQMVIENKSKIIAILRHDNKKYRQLVRPTLYYIWMIYRYLHPCNKNAEKFLYEKTHILNNKIADYEQKFIKFSNIPVFYHKLNQKDLLGYNNEIIVKNYFQRSSLYWIEKKINYLSSKRNQDKRISELIGAVDRM